MQSDRNQYVDLGQGQQRPVRRAIARVAGLLPDKLFLQLLFRRIYGRLPDLANPRTFDEKILWYNLFYRHPLMTRVADKAAVREYVSSKGLGRLLNDLYGVYDSVDEIDLARLPGKFVVKGTHGSRMIIVCRDKASLDWGRCRIEMRRWLGTCYYEARREWAYKHIRPRLICEQYLENAELGQLVDYKFYCYNGNPRVLFVCTDRFAPEGVRYQAYDMSWKAIPVFKGRPCSELSVERPANFDEMVAAARELCQGFPYVRSTSTSSRASSSSVS